MKRNGSLDFLRSLAIVLVVNGHTASVYGSHRYSPMSLGGVGVDLFFVLSGWLLGQQLLAELKETGNLDIRRFWLRRWMRTLPAYYVVLAMTFLWQILARGNFDLDLSYLWFGQNYVSRLPYFGVSWSLCVEEHFYLLLAPLLWLFFRRRWTLLFLPLLLALPSICRYMHWYESTNATHVRYDQCALGVLLAWCQAYAPWLWGRLCAAAPWLTAGGILVLAANVLSRLNPQWNRSDFGLATYALVFGSFVLLANSSPWWTSARLPGARYLADRSYSVYLLHPEALALLKQTSGLPFLIYLALSWLVSLLLAECLYRTVERPAMRARESFAASRSKDLRSRTPAHQVIDDFPAPRALIEGAAG